MSVAEETAIEAERRRLMKEKPEDFIHISEIVICVVRREKGLATLVNKSNQLELSAAIGELLSKSLGAKIQSDMLKSLAEVGEKSDIILPPDAGKIIT